MTTAQLNKFILREGVLHVLGSKLDVGVRVIDAKMSFGRVLFLVTPLVGSGDEWVIDARVTLNPIGETAALKAGDEAVAYYQDQEEGK